MKDSLLMNIHRNTRVAALCLTLLTSWSFSLGARADDTHHKPSAAAAAEAGGMTDGEVRKVDLEAGKLTLRHAEIKSLDMPPMTMVFVVKDKRMIDRLKAGDKVRFKAVNEAGKYTVTDIQLAR
jgi:Cu(I)/Ag(I) efflux system periplasmic protein CusF